MKRQDGFVFPRKDAEAVEDSSAFGAANRQAKQLGLLGTKLRKQCGMAALLRFGGSARLKQGT